MNGAAADQRKAGDRLKATLEAKGGAPVEPVKLAPKHKKMLDQLESAKDKEFDMQAQAHMEAVGLLRTYVGSGESQSLVGFAEERFRVAFAASYHAFSRQQLGNNEVVARFSMIRQ
nr:hypothetical protein A4A59_12980 [Rhizobium leguminosarum]